MSSFAFGDRVAACFAKPNVQQLDLDLEALQLREIASIVADAKRSMPPTVSRLLHCAPDVARATHKTNCSWKATVELSGCDDVACDSPSSFTDTDTGAMPGAPAWPRWSGAQPSDMAAAVPSRCRTQANVPATASAAPSEVRTSSSTAVAKRERYIGAVIEHDHLCCVDPRHRRGISGAQHVP